MKEKGDGIPTLQSQPGRPGHSEESVWWVGVKDDHLPPYTQQENSKLEKAKR